MLKLKVLTKYNKAQRRTVYPFGLYYETNENGYINFFTKRISRVKDLKPVTSFGNNKVAKNTLYRLVEQHKLCQNFTSLGKPEDHCFFYQIKKCGGACMGEEEAEAYNRRAEKILLQYGQALTDIAIIGKEEDLMKLLLYLSKMAPIKALDILIIQQL